MSKTVADFLLARLAVWGVRRIFGYPGDGINGITTALGRQDKIEFAQVRHEEEAAFMASGHAKLTGEVGLCPREGQAKCVQIDIDPTMVSLPYPADVALVGDATETLKALLPILDQKARVCGRFGHGHEIL